MTPSYEKTVLQTTIYRIIDFEFKVKGKRPESGTPGACFQKGICSGVICCAPLPSRPILW